MNKTRLVAFKIGQDILEINLKAFTALAWERGLFVVFFDF